jgi:regulator of sirC expression with transglutaminase-like and TPR domain
MNTAFRILALWICLDGCVTLRSEDSPPDEVTKLVERIRPSLVKVLLGGREGMDGLGSGFVMREDGLIATNKHVIGEARRIQIETSDGEKHDVIEVFASDVHLDLAIVRIAKKGLKPLELGDSSQVKQGQRMVAMGNPQGLDFSVVEGVVSAVREVNENEMIQVAMPIERGNSGGPLLDMNGRVLGLLTMKSMRTDNLGFAMPVNQLKVIFENPNPVPMNRWLTIGVLDPRSWKPTMGAEWTQHAGVIKSEMLGSGFGGRSLCLWVAEQPTEVFEVSVSVKLEDESGAAGLVFCSDEGDRHYGFYPTNGKMRLTRFDGPDVYSWTVLTETGSDAYRPEDWNAIRVRVEGKNIRCFVNGKQVIEQEDSGLRGGRVGLCKFRSPAAEFKNFRLGANLAERPISPEVAARIKTSLGAFLEQPTPPQKVIDQLLEEPSAGRRLIADERKKLEQSAAKLRELEKELHRRSTGKELARHLTEESDQVDLLRCSLLVSRHDNPEVDIEQYQRSLGRMVEELRSDPEIKKGSATAVRRLKRYLFDENGFHGSRHDYSSNSNSYINEVLDDREGLPITLSIVFLEMASRLQIQDVFGLALPGRFMVGFKDKGELRIIDVFEGAKEMGRSEVELSLMADGAEDSLPDEFFAPAERKAVVIRMIRNLVGNTMEDEMPTSETLPYLNLLLEIEPDSVADRVSRAMLKGVRGDKAGAREDVLWLMEESNAELSEEQRAKLADWLESLSDP